MTRKPFLHPNDPTYRIVFRHPNHWVPQQLSNREPSRDRDCWNDLHRPQSDRNDALALMYRHKPLKMRA